MLVLVFWQDQHAWREGEHTHTGNIFGCFLLNPHSQRRCGIKFSGAGLQGFPLASCVCALIRIRVSIRLCKNHLKLKAEAFCFQSSCAGHACQDCDGFCTSLIRVSPLNTFVWLCRLFFVKKIKHESVWNSILKNVLNDLDHENCSFLFTLKSFRMLQTKKIRFYGCI